MNPNLCFVSSQKIKNPNYTAAEAWNHASGVLVLFVWKLQEELGTGTNRYFCENFWLSESEGKVVHMYSIKAYWRIMVQLHSFLTSTLDAREWSNLRPGRLKPGSVPAVPIALEALYASESMWTLWRRAASLPPASNWITGFLMSALNLMTQYRLSHSRLHSNLQFIEGLQYFIEEYPISFIKKLFTVWKYWIQNFVVISFFCVFIVCG
jgi:hypothetical protein